MNAVSEAVYTLGQGRILVRASGTEPHNVMAEGTVPSGGRAW